MNTRSDLLTVYAPRPGSPLETEIAPGSAIVGSVAGDALLIDYEGNIYGAVSLSTYLERLLQASGRHTTSYPTTARRYADPDDLVEIGTFDPVDRHLTLTAHESEYQHWIPLADVVASAPATSGRPPVRLTLG